MPRQARLIPPGVLVHVVSRFVNAEFRMVGMDPRRDYLRRLAKALKRTDWRVVHFVIMSTHIHLLLVSGRDDLERLLKPVHIGVAAHLNRCDARFGPVFASRPATIVCAEESAGYVSAYLGNNAPRAGIVVLARDSQWSAHQFYLNPSEAPAWLEVEFGLELAGFSATEAGRRRYDEMVNSLRFEPRNDVLSGRALPELRRNARSGAGAQLELASPIFHHEGEDGDREAKLIVPVVCDPGTSFHPPRGVDLTQVVAAVSTVSGVPESLIRGRSRLQRAADGRRVALIIWTRFFNRPASEMAAYLGISRQAASRLLITPNRRSEEQAHRVAALVCDVRESA